MQKKMYDDKLILVTGGAGFIGSNVIRELNDKGFNQIIVIDELDRTEKWQNLVGKEFVEFLPKEETFDWIKGKESSIEAVIHLGACSSTVETDAAYLYQNNTRFSQKLYEIALESNWRFVYASSAATYGDGSQGFSDEHAGLKKLRPLNMYGLSKHWFDLWLLNQTQFKNAVGLKYFNVFGPNEGHKGRMASALYHMYPQACKENKVRLFKSSEPERFPDGGQQRDFLYVADAAKMTCAFLENDAEGIFNIGMGEPNTWNYLAESLFEAIDRPVQIEYIPMPQDLIGKYQNYSCADMQKTKKALGKKATTLPLKAAVKDYVQNYLIPGKTC